MATHWSCVRSANILGLILHCRMRAMRATADGPARPRPTRRISAPRAEHGTKLMRGSVGPV
eukprot:7020262-Prymnesium_polylepis.1